MIQPKPATISNLIAALQIFLRYGDITFPTGVRPFFRPCSSTGTGNLLHASTDFDADARHECGRFALAGMAGAGGPVCVAHGAAVAALPDVDDGPGGCDGCGAGCGGGGGA